MLSALKYYYKRRYFENVVYIKSVISSEMKWKGIVSYNNKWQQIQIYKYINFCYNFLWRFYPNIPDIFTGNRATILFLRCQGSNPE